MLKQPIYLLFIFVITLSIACKKNNNSPKPAEPPVLVPATFLHTAAKTIVDSTGKQIVLRGIAFGNEVWSDKETPDTHHTEEDFKRVKNMGMNVIRFYMNYKTFENDNAPYQYKQTGWDWLDKNIAWAKKYGIYLILNMHVPQGGFQSNGDGNALWDVTANQQRLTALWKAIAEKYKKEPQIAGFGLVNEPYASKSKQQWQELAQSITTEIRTTDKQHIIFIERTSIKNVNEEDADLNFAVIADNNTVYEFHIYDPFQFTHQLFTWAKLGDGGKYPDETIISAASSNWYTATFNNPTIAGGSSDWKYFEGEKYKITDPKIKLAVPALVGAGVGGKVYFDDIVIKEFDAAGSFVKDILTSSLDDLNGWGYWSSNNTGSYELSTQSGHSNNTSIAISGNTADCNSSNYLNIFEAKQNYYYQINGWMKGENVAATAACKLRIDLLTSNGNIYKRNKELLAASIKKYTDWAAIKNVPLYMGEFGAGIHCFQNNKGGIQWVTDMVDIAKANDIHFTYHVYHEDNFGLYFGYGTLPDPAKVNQPLIDLFTAKLK
jgi:endoglucanase